MVAVTSRVQALPPFADRPPRLPAWQLTLGIRPPFRYHGYTNRHGNFAQIRRRLSC